MTYGAIPVSMRTPPAGHVAVHASATAAQFIVPLNPGWNVICRDEAEGIASFCESNGEANRSEPWFPGERIALQALARQIRARLKEVK